MRTRAATAPRRASRQRGGITIAMVFAVIVGLLLLAVTQLGYAFYMRREMQKAADLAALSAVQVLGMGQAGDCARAAEAGRRAALANLPALFDTFTADDVTVQCKVWDPARADASAMHLLDAADGQPPNAMRVVVARTLADVVPSFFGALGDGTRVSVAAVATRSAPVAAFTVGSRLLRLEKGGLLSQLLATAGATPAQLDVLDAAGAASADITPSGLLQALGLPLSVASGVGTPEQLAAVNNLSLGTLLQATVTAIDKGGDTATAGAGLLRGAVTELLRIPGLTRPIRLFGDGGVLGLDLSGGDAAAGLRARVNARNVIETALVLANGDNLIDLGLNVPLLGLQAQARVVEPPALAVGGLGARAVSAGVRVYLRVNTSDIPLVGRLLSSTANMQLDLPIVIDVAQSAGTLTGLCAAPLQATIDVTASLANVCVGRFPGMASSSNASAAGFLSASNACQQAGFGAIDRYRVLNVLGMPVASKVTLEVFPSAAPVPVTLSAPPASPSTATVNASAIDLAGLASGLADTLVVGLLGDITQTGAPMTGAQRDALARNLVGGGGSNPGRSVSAIVNDIQWSQGQLDAIGQRIVAGGLAGVLGGTLQVVGNVLNTVLLAPLTDLGCSLLVAPGAIRECRVSAVSTYVLNGSGQVGGVVSVAIALLTPLLDALSGALAQVLDSLGLNVAQTDVALLSVDCGRPRLVY